jgi:hypothetical protein
MEKQDLLYFVTTAKKNKNATKDVVAIVTSPKLETKTRGSIGFRVNRQAEALLKRKHIVKIGDV